MKKDADIKGAELAPSSLTLGTESGRGVVSISTCWLNLVAGSQLDWMEFVTSETANWLTGASALTFWRWVGSDNGREMEEQSWRMM